MKYQIGIPYYAIRGYYWKLRSSGTIKKKNNIIINIENKNNKNPNGSVIGCSEQNITKN